MSGFRWPEAECYHQNVAFEVTIKQFGGEIVGMIPAHCVDCGHIFEDTEWSGH